MIDPNLFTVEKLLATFLDDSFGNRDVWRQNATIVTEYVPTYADPSTHPRCVVRYGESFLRHSAGPRQGHFWDVYGDDYQTPELALIALLSAPVPPSVVKQEAWEQAREARERRLQAKEG